MRDYYEILSVSRNASEQEIKRAYRQAAIRWHPDRNPDDPEATERFKEAAQAYAVLGDPQKRAHYDRFGEARGPAVGGFDPETFADFGDILGDLFGSGFADLFGGRRRQRDGPSRGADLRYDLELDFMEAALGVETEVVIPRLETCNTCGGTGARSEDGLRTCSTCGGHGQIRFQQGFFAVARTCTACRGDGREVTDPCPDCRGHGRLRREKEIKVQIPPGVENGARLRLSGQGEAGPMGGPSGDLYVFLRVREHEYFERNGLDLHCRFPITFTQAALGASVQVPGLQGEEDLKVPAGTQSGTVMRLRGRGLSGPDGRGRGDHYVHLQVVVPTRLSARQRELLEEFGETDSAAPDPADENFFQKVRKLFS